MKTIWLRFSKIEFECIANIFQTEEEEYEEGTAIMMGGAPVLEHEGPIAPNSSPTQSSMQDQMKLHQEEAYRR